MWHSTLGVTPWASYEEIRAAFKRRVLETHPDKGGRACEFRQVMLAFERASVENTSEAEVKRGQKVKRSGFEGPSTKCARKAEPKSHRKTAEPSKKRSQGKYRGRNALIQRLHAYLRQLQRDDRKIAISQKLAERHRVALEGWIQTQFCPTAGTGRCGGSRVAAEETSEEAAPLALEDLPRTPKAPKVKAAKAARAPRQQPSKGIIARAGRVRLYQVIVVVNNIELLAGGTTELARAVDVHMALTKLKQRVLKTPSRWERLAEELECAMSEHDLVLKEQRISFRVHFPVHHWTGSGLRSPTYPIRELKEGMYLWRKLQMSRLQYSGLGAKKGGVFFQNSPLAVENAWNQISEIFVEIWVKAGCDEVKTRRRLEAMRQRHEARRKTHQLEEWNRQRMAKEEQRQRICDRQRLRMEERERRFLAREDRRAGQVALYTAKVFGKIERLLQTWDRMDS